MSCQGCWTSLRACRSDDDLTGKQDESDPTIQLLRAIEHPIGKQCEILVQTCSYAATGNVLLVQEMLHHCTDHAEKPEEKEADKSATDGAAQPGDASAAPAADTEEKEKEKVAQDMTYQAFAVIGIALIAMGEEVGAAMCLRQFNHLVSRLGFGVFGGLLSFRL